MAQQEHLLLRFRDQDHLFTSHLGTSKTTASPVSFSISKSSNSQLRIEINCDHFTSDLQVLQVKFFSNFGIKVIYHVVGYSKKQLLLYFKDQDHLRVQNILRQTPQYSKAHSLEFQGSGSNENISLHNLQFFLDNCFSCSGMRIKYEQIYTLEYMHRKISS